MSTTDRRLPANFWRQFAATGVSNIGDGMVHAAAPLLTLSLTSDERLIAGVSFCSMIPWLVLSLPAGVYIDRFDRRKLMIVANIIRAALFGLIAFAASTGSLSIWIFMVILIGVGCLRSFSICLLRHFCRNWYPTIYSRKPMVVLRVLNSLPIPSLAYHWVLGLL